jgi:hypothetical protein
MNINCTPDALARMAVQGLRLDPPPTDDEICGILTRLATAFEYGPDDVAKALKLLHARFSNRMELRQNHQR